MASTCASCGTNFSIQTLTETLDIKSFEEKATLDISEFYDSFEKVGIRYDASFQVIKSAFVTDKTVLVQLSTELSTKGYAIHPAMLDGVFKPVHYCHIRTMMQQTRKILFISLLAFVDSLCYISRVIIYMLKFVPVSNRNRCGMLIFGSTIVKANAVC